MLLVGAGNVGLEKLTAVLSNAPATKVNVVALEVNAEFKAYAEKYPNVRIQVKAYAPTDLDECDIAIVATADIALDELIRQDAKFRSKLINVADKPTLCDFYLGSIVRKGSIKIAISTNGKSPTLAKRLKTVIQDGLPSELETSLDNLQKNKKNFRRRFSA